VLLSANEYRWHRTDWPRGGYTKKLVRCPTDSTTASTEFTLGRNVARREEVNVVMAQAARAGAKVVKPAHETFWDGYAGYFADPDDHVWEVAWNPQWEVNT
jgi:uncharacterized glyoxalase superfamily protein PhnB